MTNDPAELVWGLPCDCGRPPVPHRHGRSADGSRLGLAIIRPWSKKL